MTLFLWGITIIFISGFLVFLPGRGKAAAMISQTALIAGSLLTAVALYPVLIQDQVLHISLQWMTPEIRFALHLDALSALFILPVLLVGVLGRIYGSRYLPAEWHAMRQKNHWFFYHLLTAAMVLVLTAWNAVLFLIAWEVMTVASFFLVLYHGEAPSVRRAGWIYLAATQVGTALLIMMFILLSGPSGAMDFDQLVMPAGIHGTLVFLFMLVGFGAKAGLIPFHIWLPEAHPAAPSHVSALMSGVMIKTGIFGIIRIITLLQTPPAWWGWVLVGIGALSGVQGLLYAMAQHDLKRLLAYCSVENIGIITLGLGIGTLGLNQASTLMAILGFGGAVWHMLNHALFKSLLFFGAGSIQHATGSLQMDQLGGLLKRMPRTGITFLIGAAAISALPPFNGFISELLIYRGAFESILHFVNRSLPHQMGGLLIMGALALMGGLALAVFTKAFGIIFLGEPRSEGASKARENAPQMWGPMAALALGCMALGFASPWLIKAALPVFKTLLPTFQQDILLAELLELQEMLFYILWGSLAFIGFLILAGALRWLLLRGKTVQQAPTWGCAYSAPKPKMQYSASSFTQPLVRLFKTLLRTRSHVHSPLSYFPTKADLHTHTPDLFLESVYAPLMQWIQRLTDRMRWVQEGRIQLYILYIALTLLFLFIWKL